jgi:hypothetical protein
LTRWYKGREAYKCRVQEVQVQVQRCRGAEAQRCRCRVAGAEVQRGGDCAGDCAPGAGCWYKVQW